MPNPPNAYNERRFFVLIQGVDGVKGKTGLFEGKYNEFAGYVRQAKGFIWHRAVFHGFHTEAVSKEYWSGAGQEQPWDLLEPRP